MKALLVSFALLAAGVASAQDTGPPARLTPMDEIEIRFNNARAPDLFPVQRAWWSGRCYEMNDPVKALGGILAVETRDSKTKTILVFAPDIPEAVEKLTPALEKEIDQLITASWPHHTEIVQGGEGTDNELVTPDGREYRQEIRVDEDFVYARMERVKPAYDRLFFCYYPNLLKYE